MFHLGISSNTLIAFHKTIKISVNWTSKQPYCT